jgi:hypothetical protein
VPGNMIQRSKLLRLCEIKASLKTSFSNFVLCILNESSLSLPPNVPVSAT